MKTKKMLFKAAVCLMAVVVMMFSTVSALAADYYTTTTYKLGTDEVTVKTTVTDVTSGEIAYIAYTGENPEADGAIFHIDQKTSSSDNTFTYTTTADKISGTHAMLVGTQEAGKLSTEVTDKAKFGTDYTLTVEIANGSITLTDATSTTEVPNTVTFDANGTVAVANGNVLTYGLTANEGYDVANAVVTLDDVVVTETTLPAITGDAKLVVKFGDAKIDTGLAEETELTDAETISVVTDYVNKSGDAIAAKALTKFGKIILGSDAVTEYGIIISDGTDEIKVVGYGSAEQLAETDGAFAIIVEGLEDEFEGTLTVKTFVTTAVDTLYGKEFTYDAGTIATE